MEVSGQLHALDNFIPGTHLSEEWMGSRAIVDVVKKNNFNAPAKYATPAVSSLYPTMLLSNHKSSGHPFFFLTVHQPEGSLP
jgi:hypothetical protein